MENDKPIQDEQGHLIRVNPGEVGLAIGKISEKNAYDGYTNSQESEKKLLKNVFEEGDRWFNSGDLLRDLGNTG